MPLTRETDPNDHEPEMTESEYLDLVWLTKKAVRVKLEKWRKDTPKQQDTEQEEENKEIARTCKTCYFCSYTREVNKILYVRCTLEEPRWTAAEDDLPCWKLSE
ncbi:MAG: hypothetical protein RTU30_01095 [Candidatus Thorarchaeota archaeon]